MAQRGVNKVILVGNLGNDPETKYTANGAAITSISIATSETWKDKQTGQQQERTEWHKVTFFNRLAEIAGEYLRKGSKVYIEGSLRTDKWQDQNGNDRYSTGIVASEMQMLDTKNDGQGQGNQGGYAQQPQQAPQQAQRPQQTRRPQPPQNYQQGPQQQAPQQQNRRPPPPPQGQPMGAHGMDDFEDEIPF